MTQTQTTAPRQKRQDPPWTIERAISSANNPNASDGKRRSAIMALIGFAKEPKEPGLKYDADVVAALQIAARAKRFDDRTLASLQEDLELHALVFAV